MHTIWLTDPYADTRTELQTDANRICDSNRFDLLPLCILRNGNACFKSITYHINGIRRIHIYVNRLAWFSYARFFCVTSLVLKWSRRQQPKNCHNLCWLIFNILLPRSQLISHTRTWWPRAVRKCTHERVVETLHGHNARRNVWR